MIWPGRWLRSCFSTPTHASATFTAVIAIVTTVYAGVSYLQWLSLNRANEINAQNIYEIQRPFISVTTMDMAPIQSGGNLVGVGINPHPENSGSTPAENLVLYFNYYRVKDPISADYRFPDIEDVIRYPAIGAPKAIIHVPTKTYTLSELAEFQTRARYLYVYGRAEYKDRFKGTPPHVTLFCFHLLNISGPDIGTLQTLSKEAKQLEMLGFDWPACNRHNCTDEECREQGFPK